MPELWTKSVSTEFQREFNFLMQFIFDIFAVVNTRADPKCSNFSFQIDIEEGNKKNFLSAGEMPLPELYFMMSLIFFLSGLFWVFLLKKST